MIIAIRPHEIYELLSILEMLHCQSPCFHGQIQHLYSYDKAYSVSFAFWFLWGAQTTILSYQRFCCGAPKKSCCQLLPQNNLVLLEHGKQLCVLRAKNLCQASSPHLRNLLLEFWTALAYPCFCFPQLFVIENSSTPKDTNFLRSSR